MSKASQHNATDQSFGPYSGGVDDLGAVVAEVGSYTTRMGYAGEDAPRSIFRTSVAALRGDDGDEETSASAAAAKSSRRGRGAKKSVLAGPSSGSGSGSGGGNKIIKTNHGDWWHRTLSPDGTDGKWEVVSPLDASTGLIYRSPHEIVPSSGQGMGGGGNDEDGIEAMDVDGDSGGEGGGAASGRRSGKPSPDQLEASGGECYELLSRYLRHGFASSLPTSSSDQPFVLIERSYNPPPIRQKCLEVLFEEMDVPSAFLARDAVMACYAVGRSTGTVVDVGHSGTAVTPVYDGYVENRAILRSPIGGAAMDESILHLLDGLYRDKRSKQTTTKADPNVPPYVMPLVSGTQSQGQRQRCRAVQEERCHA